MTATSSNAGTLAAQGATLEESRAYCRELTKAQARNFYHGLKLLPEPKRSAMYALYAYMRLVDDIADDDAQQKTLAQRQADLDQWQELTRQAFAAPESPFPVQPLLWPAFIDLVRVHKVPREVFDEMIAGQRQDLTPGPIQTFDDLYQYCYRVASVVGIASLYVWGFDQSPGMKEESLRLATDRGIAFQLTNVLRDLREDSARGRCYLPLEELRKFQLTAEGIARGGRQLAGNRDFLSLMQFQVSRARDFYISSSALDTRVCADSRPTLVAMTSIYRGILEKISADPGRVLTQRVRLSTMTKLLIAWRALRHN